VIKNDRQYRITKAQADRFRTALRGLDDHSAEQSDIHPILFKVKHDALKSQLADLEKDLLEYDGLRAGSFDFNQLLTINELPTTLIKARIARGLSQRELAEQLGLKEQQIQRYEASEYAGASFQRINAIAAALNMEIDRSLLSENKNLSWQTLLRKLAEIGLPGEFVRRRLIPHMSLIRNAEDTEEHGMLIQAAAETLGKVFSWSTEEVLQGNSLVLTHATSGIRYKTSVNARVEKVNAYSVYAHYLSLLIIQACVGMPRKTVPTNPEEVRSTIRRDFDSYSLEALLNYVWDLGIPVLPLDDSGAFHGACFREGGRNVIVLKQNTASESRWAFDLLHELYHAGQESDSPERTVIEPEELGADEEDQIANHFAAAILLDGRGTELAERSLALAGNDLRRLKTAVNEVAEEEDVPAGHLANYLAYRLAAEQGQNWWGAANNLQIAAQPWATARNVFYERIDFAALAEPDRHLLLQALAPREELVP